MSGFMNNDANQHSMNVNEINIHSDAFSYNQNWRKQRQCFTISIWLIQNVEGFLPLLFPYCVRVCVCTLVQPKPLCKWDHPYIPVCTDMTYSNEKYKKSSKTCFSLMFLICLLSIQTKASQTKTRLSTKLYTIYTLMQFHWVFIWICWWVSKS